MKRLVKISILMGTLTGAGLGVHAAVKTNPDKIDVLKAIKLSRAVARINETNARHMQLKLISEQLNKEIASTLEEAQTLCKEAKVDLDDVLAGKAKVADDGTITRPVLPLAVPPTPPAPVATNSDAGTSTKATKKP